MNRPQVRIFDDAQAAACGAAELFARLAVDSAAAGRFCAALSGGSTPRPLHRLLGKAPFKERIPWDRVHLFWVDERMVPADHEASNFGAARRDFIDAVSIPGTQVHPMPAAVEPPQGAAEYQRKMQETLGPSPVLDLVLLGLGGDGHTASLFPDAPVPVDADRWVAAVEGGTPAVARLTLTAPVINRAQCVCFFVTGEAKAGVVQRVLVEEDRRLPAAWIRPERGRLIWILDRAAARTLKEKNHGG